MTQVKRRKSACYCINLRRAANMVSALYDTRLTPVGLSVTQFSLLVNLRRLGQASVTDLAAFVGLERTTLVRTLKPLLEKGLIEDAATAGRRERALRLSGLGEQAVAKGLPLWQSAQAEIEERIGKAGVASLSVLLSALVNEDAAFSD